MTARNSDEQDIGARDNQDPGAQAEQGSADELQLSEEGQQEVHQMVEAYEDKPTVTLPGSHGTITGTAINNWLDDEGNPKFGDPDEDPFGANDESAGGDAKEAASG